jgi:type IV secretion system protein VirB4
MDPFSGMLGFAAGLGAVRAVQALREHRREPAGLADQLGWAFMVEDGIVLQKDGSFLAGWRYRGPDLNAATPPELDLLSQHINDALLPYTDAWMFHADAVRRPARGYAGPGAFPDPVTGMIDTARREAYESGRQHYETEYYLTLTHWPPPELYSRLAAWFVQGGDRRGVDWFRVLAEYRESVRELEHRLSGRLKMERLDSDALLTHLHTCLSGLHHPVSNPPDGSYLDHLLASTDMLGGFEPRVGSLFGRDRRILPIAVHGFPLEVHAGVLDALNGLPFAYRWSNRIIPLSTRRAGKLIASHQRFWALKRRGVLGLLQDDRRRRSDAEDVHLDLDANRMVFDAREAAAENSSGAVRFCYYTPTILVMEEDAARAGRIADEILKVLQDRGFTAGTETVNATEAYLGSLPGHGYPNLRKPLVSSRNIADMLPITAVWPGLASNPSPLFPRESPALLWGATQGSTPFRVNLHHSDVGHTLVLGPTGSGKSILLNLLAAQFRRYAGAQTFVFDVDYSALLLAVSSGARHYDVAAGKTDSLRLQPLAEIHIPAERSWAAEWLEVLFGLQGVNLTPPLREKVARALALVAENRREHRTLTALLVQLQDETLSSALRPYTVDGALGHLLDAGESDIGDAPHEVFELRHLMDLSDKVLVPTLLYLFHHVERKLDGQRPTLMIVDEAWMALSHSLFGRRISDWLLTLRKKNGAVVLGTQSLSQLDELPTRSLIVESCPTRILLPNPEALTDDVAELYRGIGLNDTEIRTVATAIPKRHYYFKSPRGSRLFELGLGPVELSFLAAAEGETIGATAHRAGALIAQHGPDWIPFWLRQHGLGQPAEPAYPSNVGETHARKKHSVFAAAR